MPQIPIEQKNLMDLLKDVTCSEWDRIAFCDYNTDVKFSHKDVFEQISRLHIVFSQYGIKRGDKIAICDKNSSNWAVCFLAAFTYGAVVVPILADFNVDQVDDIVEHSDSKLLLTNLHVFENCKKTDKRMIIDVRTMRAFQSPSESRLSDIFGQLDNLFVQKYPNGVTRDDVVFEDVNPDDLAVISYTSGSTGNPKGVMIPYRAIWSNNVFAHKLFPLAPGSKFLSLLPLAHMFGFAFDFIFPYTLGGHISFLTRIPSPQIVLKAFKEIRPAIIISVPLVIEKIIQGKVLPELRKPTMSLLLKIPGIKTLIYSRIRKQLCDAFGGQFEVVILGGAAVNREVDNLLHEIKFPYTIGYGMTECAPLICYEDYDKFAVGSCGKAVDRMDVKVLSDDPEHISGEIVCRGVNVMLGYYKNEQLSKETIDEDGWLHTGDLGTIDKQGNVFINGRQKNMLLGANGQNIYPEEIESMILSTLKIDETVLVQRDQKLVALIYVSDNTLEINGLTREKFMQNLDTYKKEVNAVLPKFAQLCALEVRDTEFEKTPKRNIKRFLYK